MAGGLGVRAAQRGACGRNRPRRRRGSTEYALEKQKAFATGAIKAGAAAMVGSRPEVVVAAALAPSRKRVRANARKLAKGG